MQSESRASPGTLRYELNGRVGRERERKEGVGGVEVEGLNLYSSAVFDISNVSEIAWPALNNATSFSVSLQVSIL
jgi:hypothetical protein